MQRTLGVLLCAGLVLAPFGASYAQNPQPAAPGVTHLPVALPSAPTPPPEKLAQQNGTLQPPETGDRGTVMKPKQGAGTMPVIPPPGTKGGNQRVVPK